MSPNDNIAASDEMTTEVVHNNTLKWVRVKVLAENGIFKNGVAYAAGEEACFSRQAALGFEADGDVEILGDVDVEVHQTKNADGQVQSHLDKVVVKENSGEEKTDE